MEPACVEGRRAYCHPDARPVIFYYFQSLEQNWPWQNLTLVRFDETETLQPVTALRDPNTSSCSRRYESSEMWRRVGACVLSDVSKDHSFFIFRFKRIFLDCLILRVWAPRSIETSGTTRTPIWRHISEDRSLQPHCCNSIKPRIPFLFHQRTNHWHLHSIYTYNVPCYMFRLSIAIIRQ
jgi:hypothetical protein